MHGESAEGEREEPATNNINQNSSGWGRKNFKMLKKKAHKIHCWCIFFRGQLGRVQRPTQAAPSPQARLRWGHRDLFAPAETASALGSAWGFSP